jgi:ribosomal protein L40E
MILQTLLNETASRYSVAFEVEENDEVVLLYDTMNHLTIQSQKVEDWVFELEKFLSIDGSLPSKGIRFDLSALSVITLLAIFDFYQYAYHYSCLTHTVPMETFTIKEIKERLDEADKEDHRWLLKSFAKVFPAEIAEAFVIKDLTPAIEELVKAGFIELRAEEEGKNVPVIYGFSNELNRLKQAAFFAVSKLSMRVSGVNKDGKVGFETLQFIRDGTGLTMFGVTGDKGVFMRLSQEDWGTLLERLIPGKRTTDQPTVRMRVDKPAFCIKCGSPNARDSKFCSKCGAKLP